MRKTKGGFEYSLSEETLREFKKKPLELRLKWLYMGNLLRMHYNKRIIILQDRFREGRY